MSYHAKLHAHFRKAVINSHGVLSLFSDISRRCWKLDASVTLHPLARRHANVAWDRVQSFLNINSNLLKLNNHYSFVCKMMFFQFFARYETCVSEHLVWKSRFICGLKVTNLAYQPNKSKWYIFLHNHITREAFVLELWKEFYACLITMRMGAIWWGTRRTCPPSFSDGGT